MRPDLRALHARLESDHWWFVARRYIVTRVLCEVLPPTRDLRVIDVGCGTGATVAGLAEHYSCLGVDPDPNAIRLARERFPDCDFIQGAVPEALDELAGRADGFLLMDVLEHIEDDRLFLRKLVSMAMPGALFLITVPALPELWSPHDVALGHHRRYTDDSLEELLGDAAIHSLMVSYFNARLYPVIHLWRRVKAFAASDGEESDLGHVPQPFNQILEKIFSGEARRLVRKLRGKDVRGYHKGVSLMAVAKKD
jgi:SAM-dependent methyltransferase